MNRFLSLCIAMLMYAIHGNAALRTTPSKSDLLFPDLASVWDEAIPLGNAILGELIWQNGDKLRFSLDRSDLWDLRPSNNMQGDHFSFEWIRQHIRSKDYAPVIEKFEKNRDVAPSKVPGAALEFETSGWGEICSSRLYLHEALCQVNWTSGIQMQSFVQADRPVGWFVFENIPDTIQISLRPPLYGKRHNTAGNGGMGAASLALLGYEQGEVMQDGNLITYRQNGWDGFYYDVAVMWKRQGKRIVGAWSITSSLVHEKALDEVKLALRQGLKQSFHCHMEYWKSYWNRSIVSVPDTIVQRQYDREMYKFGSASRKNSYPISLQSVWTADDGRLPPWKGDYHHDLNTQLSYWPAYSSNHLDEGMAYLNTLWNQRNVHKAFTKKFFGKDGLNVPGTCALDGELLGGWVQYSLSQTTAAWLAQHFWLHWKYSADRDFLTQRGYPYLHDVATFLEQQSEVGADGVRRLEFTSSPEINNNRLDAWFADFTNYDLSLMRFAFTAAAEMADSLRLTDEAVHWRRLAAQLPDYALDEDGALSIAPGLPYKHSHRHFSHAMAIYPLGLLDIKNSKKEKQIVDATLRGLHKYGPDWWVGFSYSWLANLEARAGHGSDALKALQTFSQCFCLRNSFHANGDQTRSGKSKFTYRPFTLEGNFAFASGLQEMLIQSHTGIIEIFPAIPDEWRQDIHFERLRAMGAFLVSAEIKDGQVKSLKVYSEKGGLLCLRHPQTGKVIKQKTSPKETIRII